MGLLRRIQPNITSMHQKMCDMEVVVLHKGISASKGWIDCSLVDFLHTALASFVGRMKLASAVCKKSTSEQSIHPLEAELPLWRTTTSMSHIFWCMDVMFG